MARKPLNVKWLKVYVNLTYDCDNTCLYCSRMLDKIRVKRSHLPYESVHRMLCWLKQNNAYIGRLKIGGGDPMCHPLFWEIIDLIWECGVQNGVVHQVQISTTGNRPIKRLPRQFMWRLSRADRKEHYPFMVAPQDVGVMSGKWRNCLVPTGCGIGFDKDGWCYCPVAMNLGRLFNIDVWSDEPIIEKRRVICKLCSFGMSFRVQRMFQQMIESRELKHPSETYQAALDVLDDKTALTHVKKRQAEKMLVNVSNAKCIHGRGGWRYEIRGDRVKCD